MKDTRRHRISVSAVPCALPAIGGRAVKYAGTCATGSKPGGIGNLLFAVEKTTGKRVINGYCTCPVTATW